MNPLVFSKKPASSCLVPEKTWDEVIGKPELFEQMARRVYEMAEAAGKVELLKRSSSLRTVKEVVKSVLLDPLEPSLEDVAPGPKHVKGNVLADAFWDEIDASDDFWHRVKDYITEASVMKQRIAENTMLSDGSTLQDVKNLINSAVLNPLQGADKGE